MNFYSLLTPWRLKWYSISILFALFSGLIIVLFTSTGTRTITGGRVGGDFTPFYATGRLLANSDFNGLYDRNVQIESQKDLFPDHTGLLAFPYPPYVALACIPLSWFSYPVAYALHVIISICAFYLSFINIRKLIPLIDRFFLPAFTISLTFYPIFAAVFKGQLTAFILMLYTLIWRFTKEGKPFWAGLFMGLLLFKPQFAVPLIGLFILSGRIKIALTAIFTSTLIIAVGLLFTGIEPYIAWVDFLKWFVPADAVLNKHNAVSWIGFLDAIFGTENKLSIVIGHILCFVTVLFISYIWAAGGKLSDINAQIGLAAVCFVLIPPHVMYYDAGLILLTYAVLIERMQTKQIALICVVWLIGLTPIFADKFGFSLVFFLVIFTLFQAVVNLTVPAIQKT
jgi:hypothetical protein